MPLVEAQTSKLTYPVQALRSNTISDPVRAEGIPIEQELFTRTILQLTQ